MNAEEKILGKLGQIDSRLSGIDSRLEKMDGRFEVMDGRFEVMDGRFEVMDGRFEVMDGRYLNVEGTQNRIVTKLVDMDATIKEMKRTMVTKDELRETKSEIMTHIDGFAKRQEKFDHELVSVRVRVDRIEGKA